MRYLFFINPAAGKGRKQREIITSIENYFSEHDGDFHIHVTEFAGDAEQTARKEAQSGEEIRMFACGGEGTCYEVLNGIADFDNVSLGVMPCGSANDFLKVFSDKSLFLDIAAQISGEAVPIDIIKAGDRYCINSCSVGMDAMVARDMGYFKRCPLISGSAAYKLAIVRTFIRKLGVNSEIFLNGESIGKKNCLFAVAANAPFYGGGYMAAPDAVINDGLLDFTLVDVISRFKILKFLPLYESGDIKGLDCCHLNKCTSMAFKAEQPVPVNLDGEISLKDSLEFSIVKNGLKFVLPAGINMPENIEKEKFVNII